ncbi:hypothetical protein [Engelhardtia mirabilis]|uniref:Uncharacterized protein n=1 Tax=Engelhardtia mirabilis TaxID=2528011 RepID=A0A518BJP0_9BACT|nr:hypothetical protein Pla133_22660 [Planctomycetes bacterium Pla133]QDV01515.1 hypothetical protein Pla86_22660 [Planctomycetes bacterium Pla86]
MTRLTSLSALALPSLLLLGLPPAAVLPAAVLPAAVLPVPPAEFMGATTPSSPAARALSAVAAAAQELSYEDFKAEFRQASKIGDTRNVGQLIRRNEMNTRNFVIFTAEAMGETPGPDLGQDLKWLKAGWKEAHGTSFVSKMETYYQLMRPEVRRAHVSAKARYDKVREQIIAAKAQERSDERSRKLEGLAEEAMAIHKSFDEIGDHYYASEIVLLAGTSVNAETLTEEEANLPLVLEAYKAFIEHRDSIELEGANYTAVKEQIAYLETLGAALDPNTAAGLSLGSGMPFASTFTTIEELTAIERPNYWADDAALTWQAVGMGRVGSDVKVGNIDGGPTIERSAFETITIRPLEGDPIEVALSGRTKLIETTVGRSSELRPWAFLMRNATNPEYLFGISMNYSPTDEFLTVYLAPAAAAEFEVDGVKVQVIDDNLDGIYGSPPLLYTRYGMREKEYEPVVDSVVIDGAKKALPWSTLVQIGEQWYQIDSIARGKSFTLYPAELNTGTIKLDAKGVEFASLLIEGVDALQGAVFDISDAKKGQQVPAGKYQILGGTVREGGRSIVKAGVTAPLRGGAIYVRPDEEVEVQFGAPFGFDFDAELDGDQITVIGSSVVPVGVAGERYHRMWETRNSPEISIRKAGSGRGGKGTKMQVIGDAQTITDLGQDQAWKPLDQSVENKYGAEVEIMLTEKKNKLLGKIESDWKPPVQ